MNQLSGHLLAIDTQGSVSIADVAIGEHGKLILTAMVLGAAHPATTWSVGQPVTMLFKESEVALARQLSGQISLRNRMPGQVVALEQGRLLTRVRLALQDVSGSCIESLITTRSATSMQLAIGDQLEALVKSNEMSMMPQIHPQIYPQIQQPPQQQIQQPTQHGSAAQEPA
jgi:molybdate transport system regulatory protein